MINNTIHLMTVDWRKNLRRMALAGLLLPCLLASSTGAQSPDLSTNEAVLAELQRIADAKLEALGKPAGRKLEARFVCIKRLKESAEIIVIGGFAYDRGCRFQGVFVNSRYFEKDDAALSKNAPEIDNDSWRPKVYAQYKILRRMSSDKFKASIIRRNSVAVRKSSCRYEPVQKGLFWDVLWQPRDYVCTDLSSTLIEW